MRLEKNVRMYSLNFIGKKAFLAQNSANQVELPVL